MRPLEPTERSRADRWMDRFHLGVVGVGIVGLVILAVELVVGAFKAVQ